MKGKIKGCDMHKCAHHGCIYWLGIIGAAIYYISTSTGFWGVILAILKALVWPVFVVMKILGI